MSEVKFKACIYTRLSREDGDKIESDSITNQKSLIRDFVKKYPDIQVVLEKVDDGYSGVNFERPAFKELMEEIRLGRVNCVIVKDLSRFGRNYIEVGNYIERVFPFMGVRFISINDNYDSNNRTQTDSLLIPFKNLMNDAYCNDISIKIRSQLDVKRKNGKFIGAFAVYGYLKDPLDHNKLIPDVYAAEVVRSIFKWKLQGMSQGKIADKLNLQGVLCPMEYKLSMGMKVQTNFKMNQKALWSVVPVTRILTNEIYTGTLIQGKSGSPNYKIKKVMPKDKSEWIRVENAHEAIIDKKTFESVQRLLERDVRVGLNSDKVYMFSGYVKCADCGQNMVYKVYTYETKKYATLVCSTNKKGNGCSTHSIKEDNLKESVLEAIKHHIQLILNMEDMMDFINSLPVKQANIVHYDEQITKLQEDIKRNQAFKLKLYENLQEGLIEQEEYILFKERYSEKIKQSQMSIIAVEEEREHAINKNKMDLAWIEDFKKYKNITELDRQVIVELIDYIEVYKDKRINVVFRHKNEYEKILRMIEYQFQKGSG